MPFNASVNLGTIGNGITGQTVSISGCTGASCGSGCTSLTTSQAVSSFPKTITGIPDNVVSLFVRVDGGDCSGTSQCISITGIPGATPTPTTTPTINPTITPTTTPTINPTITPTTTTTPTINPTITPTTTPTAGNCQINGTAFVNVSNPTATGQIVLQTTGRIMNVSVFGGATSGGSNSVTLTVTGSGLTPTPSPNSVTISANAFATNTGTLVLPVTGTYNYTITMTPNGSSGHSASFECGNQFISTPTPTITSTPTYNFYRAGEVLQSNLSTTYCSQQGYLISGELYSATPYASITPGSTLLYTDYGLTQLFTGGGVGYIVAISDIADVNTNSGTIKYIQVDGQGNILTLGTFNCSGGGGGGGFNQV